MDQDDPLLGSRSRRRADRALGQGQLSVSAISFWEIAMLAQRGRIDLRVPLASWRRDLLASGLVEVPVDGEVGIAATGLEDLPGDPADRMIAATATLNGALLITADHRLLNWSGRLDRHDARL